jgi:heptosyltransferase-2
MFPAAYITILAKPWVAPVFTDNPHVNEIIRYDSKGGHKGIAGRLRLARQLRQKAYDAAILLPNAIDAALIFRAAKIPVRCGFDTDFRRPLLTHAVRCTRTIKRCHQVHYYLALLAALGMPAEDQQLALIASPEASQQAQVVLETYGINADTPLIGINPGAAYGTAKRWHPERFAQVADRLQRELKLRVLIFGSAGERPVAEAVARWMRTPAINLAGRTTLEEAMALIERCRLFITNDSGLMHVAAAFNVPQVAIFGPTNAAVTRPWSVAARVVRDPVDCAPCMRRECPLSHHACMAYIDTERVYQNAVALLV